MDEKNPYAANDQFGGQFGQSGQQPGQSGQPIPPADPNGPVPAAYDTQGRPLYYAPPPGVPVYSANPVGTAAALGQFASGQVTGGQPGQDQASNKQTQSSSENMQRAEASKKQYPQLNLSDGEYVVAEVKRHPFGLLQIWFIAFALIGSFAALLYGYLSTQDSATVNVGSIMPLALGGLALISIFVVIGAIVASYVYNNNKFFVTSESVIQEIQESLFGKHEQTVSLGRIEDASFFQDGFLPAAFNYGRIRLSTVGDESTYQFNYVSDPKKVLAQLNNQIEHFKNIHS